MKKGIKTLAAGAMSAVTALSMGVMPVAAANTTVQPPKGAWFNGDLGALIGKVLNITFAIGVILALAYLIWGAFNWITSGGDKSKTAEARNKIVAAVVGLVLLGAAWGILTVVLTAMGAGGIPEVIQENFNLAK